MNGGAIPNVPPTLKQDFSTFIQQSLIVFSELLNQCKLVLCQRMQIENYEMLTFYSNPTSAASTADFPNWCQPGPVGAAHILLEGVLHLVAFD